MVRSKCLWALLLSQLASAGRSAWQGYCLVELPLAWRVVLAGAAACCGARSIPARLASLPAGAHDVMTGGARGGQRGWRAWAGDGLDAVAAARHAILLAGSLCCRQPSVVKQTESVPLVAWQSVSGWSVEAEKAGLSSPFTVRDKLMGAAAHDQRVPEALKPHRVPAVRRCRVQGCCARGQNGSMPCLANRVGEASLWPTNQTSSVLIRP